MTIDYPLRISRGAKPAPPKFQSQERGYVLLFALGLLAVVTTLLLSITVSLRLDTQLLAREKVALQESYVLRGAAHYTAIQLGVASAVAGVRPPLSNESLNRWSLWQPDGKTYEAPLGSARVRVELEDVSGLPDANMLSSQEWERLFLLLGSPTPQTAKVLAAKVIELREQLIRTRSTAGFTSLEELLEWKEISSAFAHGDAEKNTSGLRHYVVVGTRNKEVDLNTTPLPLLQVLGNVSGEHLQRLAKLRQLGPVSPELARQWLLGTGLTAIAQDASPAAVRARLRIASSPAQGLTLIALLANDNGNYSIVDQMFDRGTAAQ